MTQPIVAPVVWSSRTLLSLRGTYGVGSAISNSVGIEERRYFGSSSASHDLGGEERKGRYLARALRDESIDAPRVRLIDPETNELINGLFAPRDLLRSIDRSRFYLLQVNKGAKNSLSKPEEASEAKAVVREPSQRETPPHAKPLVAEEIPICKLISIETEDAQRRAAMQQKKEKRGQQVQVSAAELHKEARITWQSTAHDQSHKLTNLRANMIKRGAGSTCKLIVRNKKGKALFVPKPEKEALLEELERFMCDWSSVDEITGEAQEAEQVGGRAATKSATKLPYHPRRRGEVEWQNDRQASLVIEVVNK